MEIKNPVKLKVAILIAAVFVLGGATAVVNYAHGAEVIAGGEHIHMVSHTEYMFNEVGQIIVRIVDYQGNPIVVTNCTASILYPNKTYFVQDQLMINSTIAGDLYYGFTTPANGPAGVYEYQATCNYAPNKIKRATNSFHLSSAFSEIFSDLDYINTTIINFEAEVQDNFTTVIDLLNSINSSETNLTEVYNRLTELNITTQGINTNLNNFISTTNTQLTEINSTTQSTNTIVTSIQSDLTLLNTTMNTRFDSLTTLLAGNFTNIFANLSDIRQLILDINATIVSEVNDVHTDLLSINTSITNQISAVNLSITTDISDFRTEVQANFSVVNNWLDYVNITTVNTYDYITGTMATNINSLLTTVGVINATVNRIEQNTEDINSTVNTIQQNQEDEVFINVFSG